jgi:serine/threonine protein kinase/Flp pilus assembly protein TadD
VADETNWDRIASLFEQLLNGADAGQALQSEPDAEVRAAAEELWRHHRGASEDVFLERAPGFAVLPVFQPGQILLNRFEINRMLGRGGMGEVYLAYDRRMEERVALKTVARLLAPSQGIRRRIVAEVQNARRVTHPNVCRIHELFEDGETVFFSMEYVDGRLLSELMDEPVRRQTARLLVRQLAEGLWAAHRTGVVHGDLKPGNVMVAPGAVPRAVIMDFGLARAVDRATAPVDGQAISVRAGTIDFMAPELRAGGAPTVQSDIFAFGTMARMLIPDERIWEQCVRPNPTQRHRSLETILRKLTPNIARRAWLAGAGVAAAGAMVYSVWPKPGRIHIPEGKRVLVNGFRPVTASLDAARLVRSLLVTALRQSPVVRAVADEELLAELAKIQRSARLPVGGTTLEKLSVKLNAGLCVDADLFQTRGRYTMRVQVRQTPEGPVVAEVSFADFAGVIAVAQEAAWWLRNASGESQESLKANPANASAYTSRVPEALQKYYEAVELRARAEMNLAIPLFEEAIRLDPNFAQAHSALGMTVNPFGQYERAYQEVARAVQLSSALPERERNWIEANYSALTEDTPLMMKNALRTIDYYPDEPRGYRWLASLKCRSGEARDAVPYNRKTVELSGGDELARSDLINTLCEAGQFEEGLAEYEAALNGGIHNQWLHGSGGFAYLGLGRYEEALAAYGNEPAGSFRTLDMQRARVLLGDLDGAIATSRELRAAAESVVERHKANETLCGLYFVSDRHGEARKYLHEMTELPIYPQMARRLDCTAFWAARLNDRPVLAAVIKRLGELAARWPNQFTHALEQHARGLAAWLDGSMSEAESLLLESSGGAFSIWSLFDLADLYAALSKPAAAEDYFRRFDEHRGTLISFWFTGSLVLFWLRRAMAAQARNDRAQAALYSKKVLDHWSKANPRLAMVQAAANINRAVSSF